MHDFKFRLIFAIVLFIIVTTFLFLIDAIGGLDNEKHRERFDRLGYDFAKYMIIWIIVGITFFYFFEYLEGRK
jgi:preprotein translocase subunit SecY